MKRFFVFLKNEIVYNGHFQSLGAVAIVYTADKILGLPTLLGLFISVYALFQAIYYFDRYKDLDHDLETNPERTNHLKKYEKIIPLLIVLLIGFALIVPLIQATVQAFVFVVLVAIFGFLYPVFFKLQTARIPLFKNFYVAFVFGLLILFPFLYLGYSLANANAFIGLFSFVFFESLVAQMILDLKDVKTDTKKRLLTIPVLVGVKRALYVIVGTSLIALAMGVFYSKTLQLPALASLAMGAFALNAMSLFLIGIGRKQGYLLVALKYWFWPIFLVLI